MTELHNLPAVKTRSKKRLGRGTGSGKGNHTVGRGQKGQSSRSGRGIPLWFEGGQLPLLKRLPFLRGKKRFKMLNLKPQLVSLNALEKLGAKQVTPATLKAAHLIENEKQSVKITGVGEVKIAIMLSGVKATKSAKRAIEKAGGKLS